jgi:hypothetical protein
MRNADPEFSRVKTLLDAAKNPERLIVEFNIVPAHQLRNINTVYKVNVYGPHIPFDAHSTWLFALEPDDNAFYGFMYCETLQPFSSVKRYITAGCTGEHKGSRYYRIGVYDSDWVWNGNRPLFGTFGDQNLDTVMKMSVKQRVNRVRDSNLTMNGYFQGSSQAEEGDEAINRLDVSMNLGFEA